MDDGKPDMDPALQPGRERPSASASAYASPSLTPVARYTPAALRGTCSFRFFPVRKRVRDGVSFERRSHLS
jgi:hypothetical protein